MRDLAANSAHGVSPRDPDEEADLAVYVRACLGESVGAPVGGRSTAALAQARLQLGHPHRIRAALQPLAVSGLARHLALLDPELAPFVPDLRRD
jgi:hypothetical protein